MRSRTNGLLIDWVPFCLACRICYALLHRLRKQRVKRVLETARHENVLLPRPAERLGIRERNRAVGSFSAGLCLGIISYGCQGVKSKLSNLWPAYRSWH